MMKNIVLIYVLFCFMIILNCSSQKNRRTDGHSLLDERKKEINAVLKLNKPVLLVKQNDIKSSSEIQDIFISNSKLDKFFVEPSSQKKMLNEIFSISKARPSDLPNGNAIMNMENLYRVEMYNYALNASIIGFVDLAHKQVINIIFYKETQPDIPPHLVELAMEMAINDTAVINEYGEHKLDQRPIMAGTKTALNRTKCQRSKHLCVAPTFVKGDKALWAIVDLTDLNIAGVKWTQVGETGMAVTQRTMQNDKIMSCYCDKNNVIEKNDWTFSYSMSRSDGLVLTNVQYKKKELFRNVKLVDWHVSYSKIDGFGYSDAVGCPEFSTAAVLAVEPPYFEAIVESGDTTGFLLGQRYYSEGWPTPCNYNYHQYFEFYNDGRFRPVVGSIGRGCGNNGMYRPVTRIAVSGEKNNFYEWNKNTWKQWKNEQWTLQTGKTLYQGDHQWLKTENDNKQGLVILANTGQMRDGGRGDNAYVYVTKWDSHRDEGETDLPTIGPCCNKDYQQGPEKFIEPDPEIIQTSSIVLWYVAQMTNDDTKGNEYCWAESVLKNGVYVPVIYPCYSGPMFKPY
ncbi:MAG: hypothetical protein IPK88_08705 [Saprospiraceae bacterium]|nr:hypothetical protein [Candidatus Defluviibacterium haderslevense]